MEARGAPRLRLLSAIAAGAALIAAGRDAAALLRARAPSTSAALWPDPIGEAEASVRRLAADSSGDPYSSFVAAEQAGARAPRRGSVHLLTALLASEARQSAPARRELGRASASDPFHGALQAAVARALLVDAVEGRSDELLRAAARSFAAAVAVGAVACEEAYTALSAAEAPRELFELVAGRDPQRLERLIEHHASALDRAGALAAAARLDRLRRDPDRRGRALACRRLGAALLVLKRGAEAAREFEQAAALDPDPDALALDRADALLMGGANGDGAALLLRAIVSGQADSARAAGSLRCASDPAAAADALFELGRSCGDDATRATIAAVFAELGERTRASELLSTASGRRG